MGPLGWLLPLVPDAVAHRAQLEYLLADPEMAALIAAAPEPMGRVLRPLCWMLGITPPPLLAAPARKPPQPAPPRAAPQATAAAKPRPVRRRRQRPASPQPPGTAPTPARTRQPLPA